MHRAALPCLLALIAGPALAEPWACNFTVECSIGADCTAVSNDLEIIAADHSGELFLSTLSESFPVTRLTEQGALPAAYASTDQGGNAELLTIDTDRTATITLHFFDTEIAAITYLGSCEELK
jgi:hypothetical protein